MAPDQQRQGFATELARADLSAATKHRPDLPVVAYLLEQNHGSRAIAEKIGMRLAWRGPDRGNPDPHAVRRILADRALTEATLQAVIDT